MIRSLYIPKEGLPQWDLPVAAISGALADPDGLLWVSLEKPSADEIKLVLADLFHFHPLAIEDTQSVGYQTPKVDDYGAYLFMVILAVMENQNPDELLSEECDIFLGQNYVVSTYHGDRMPAVDKLRQRLQREQRLLVNGSDFLCHALIDIIVDEIMPPLENLEGKLEEVEEHVLNHPRTDILEQILRLKHTIMTVRRVVAPQREVINRLAREEFPMIDQHSQLYFRDIYDHLVRVYDWIDILRDMATNSLEVYLNATSLRLNEVMKALTIVSTIFLPLAFVAGVYGMNFKFMPELNWKAGYPLVWVVFLLISAGMLYFFKRRKWF